MKSGYETMPSSIDNLFVPPDGAMQFVFTDYPNDPIWVEGEIKSIHDPIPGCKCVGGHVVLRTGKLRVVSLTTGMHPTICECWGRIIE